MTTLPMDIVNKIILYLRHPVAEIMNNTKYISKWKERELYDNVNSTYCPVHLLCRTVHYTRRSACYWHEYPLYYRTTLIPQTVENLSLIHI